MPFSHIISTTFLQPENETRLTQRTPISWSFTIGARAVVSYAADTTHIVIIIIVIFFLCLLVVVLFFVLPCLGIGGIAGLTAVFGFEIPAPDGYRVIVVDGDFHGSSRAW